MTYLAIHTHKYGASYYFFKCNTIIDTNNLLPYIKKQIIKQLSINFEETSEFLEVIKVEKPKSVKL